MNKLEALRNQFHKATLRLDEVLQEEKSDIVRDSAIKRFEFTFDLSWKFVKAFLQEEKGVVCNSPKECFREAYQNGILDYDEFWIKMTDWRNKLIDSPINAVPYKNLIGTRPNRQSEKLSFLFGDQIVHAYGETFADELYGNLPEALKHFLSLESKISSS